MPLVAKPPVDPWPRDAFSEQDIHDGLEFWRARLIESNAGRSTGLMTRREILLSVNRLLDERLDLRGR